MFFMEFVLWVDSIKSYTWILDQFIAKPVSQYLIHKNVIFTFLFCLIWFILNFIERFWIYNNA